MDGALPRDPGRTSRRLRAAALLVALATLLVAAGCGMGPAATATPLLVEAVTPAPFGQRATAYDPPVPAPELRLTGDDGAPFDLAERRGAPAFVYFGFTHCPDVCPTTLADLRAGIRAAGVDALVIFVTVDPARDDVAALRTYVSYYGPGFVGLTGTEDEIARTAAAWGVAYRRLEHGGANDYAMAHGSEAYLVDAAGMLRHRLPFGTPPETVARVLLATAEAVTAP